MERYLENRLGFHRWFFLHQTTGNRDGPQERQLNISTTKNWRERAAMKGEQICPCSKDSGTRARSTSVRGKRDDMVCRYVVLLGTTR